MNPSDMLLSLPYQPLAALPTPVESHETLARAYGMRSFQVKRDDKTHSCYGGNKVRKLGFLLAHAQQKGYRSVITFGGAGSNHALATALFARQLGMGALLVLGPQHNSRHVRANLLSDLKTGAYLFPCDWKNTARTAARAIHDAWKRDGKPPYVIPSGGSSPLGTAGYVNAAFELRRQVDNGLLPEPDLIYVASGTMGTCVGLALGLRAAGLNTRVMAVRVTTPPYTSLDRARRLFTAANRMLHQRDDAFPLFPWDDTRFTIRDDFFGGEYALFTHESMAAVRQAREQLKLQLEGTYTGKAFAALLYDAATGRLAGKNVLFWDTYAGDNTPLSASAADGDWRTLPAALQRYFIEPVQPLDTE